MQKMKLAFGLILMFALAKPGQGQGIGGLIKKKVEQATKPKEEPTPKSADQEPSIFSFEPTAEAMASFKRGLELEARLRTEYRSRLAKLKTSEQYVVCEQEAATSADALKLAEEVSARMEKTTSPEDLQKIYVWQNERFKAIALKQCGEDPRPLLQQQREVFSKAELAGVIEAAKGWKRKPLRDDHDSAREELHALDQDQAELEGPAEPARIVPVATPSIRAPCLPVEHRPQSSEIDLQDYRLIKELLVKYCELPFELKVEATKNGLRVSGTGDNVFWVFPKWFANWVGLECDWFIKLYTMLEDSTPPQPK